MSTVDKALSVLDLFSESDPNLGLSEISRKLGWDKSNVNRYVNDLARRGILEQDSRDKTYYLGPAIARLAMVRSRTHPISGELQRVLEDLVEAVGETAHASEYVSGDLITISVVETKKRGTRVYVDPADPLPFHASGSGIAFLSQADEERVAEILAQDLKTFTDKTTVSTTEIARHIQSAKQAGYAKMVGSFESDVVGIAAPIIGFDGFSVGAVAVATPVARFSRNVEGNIAANVVAAANRISKLHGAG